MIIGIDDQGLNKKKIYLVTRHSLTSNNQTCNTRNTGSVSSHLWRYFWANDELWVLKIESVRYNYNSNVENKLGSFCAYESKQK